MLANIGLGNGAFNMNVDFSGGLVYEIDLGQNFSEAEIESTVIRITGQSSPQVRRVTGTTIVTIRIASIPEEVKEELISSLMAAYDFPREAVSMDEIDPTISAQMRWDALRAVIFACIVMLIYISIRFRHLITGSAVIIALLHDALIVMSFYSILRVQMSYSFIAAMLTVIAYSINANIVIFDRVRENKKAYSRITKAALINKSVMQTLRRSVYTSVSTLFALIFLYILGVQALREFTLPIIIGIVAGTYSSVFILGSLWYMMSTGEILPKKDKTKQINEVDTK
jgi:preprotein translocase SecF subunit